jgi:hypothetical protein
LSLVIKQSSDPNPFRVVSDESPGDIDADITDTLKEGSFDEEYDVVDEDENTVNKRHGLDIIAGRNRELRVDPPVDTEISEKIRSIKSDMSTVNMFQLKDTLLKDKYFGYSSVQSHS